MVKNLVFYYVFVVLLLVCWFLLGGGYMSSFMSSYIWTLMEKKDMKNGNANDTSRLFFVWFRFKEIVFKCAFNICGGSYLSLPS